MIRNKSGVGVKFFALLALIIISGFLIFSFYSDSFSSAFGSINSQALGKIGVFVRPPDIGYGPEQEAVAEAGLDQYACIDEEIELDGSQSTSSEDDPIEYYYWNPDSEANPDHKDMLSGVRVSTTYSDILISQDYTVTLFINTRSGKIAEDTLTIHVLDKCVNTFDSLIARITPDSVEEITITRDVEIKKAELVLEPLPDASEVYPTYLLIDIGDDNNPEWADYSLGEESFTADLKRHIQQHLDKSTDEVVVLKFRFKTDGNFKITKLAVPYELATFENLAQ